MMKVPGAPLIVTALGPYDLGLMRKSPEHYMKRVQDGAAGMFEELGSLPMSSFVYTLHPPLRPEKPDPIVVHLQLDEVNESIKQWYAAALHHFIQATSAVAIAWVSETWMARCKGDAEQAESEAWRKKHGTYEGFRLTEERLSLNFETKAEKRFVNARILRDGPRPKAGPWEEMPRNMEFEGRFSHLLMDIPTVHA